MIFKSVGSGRPYPDHALTTKGWTEVPPRQVRLDDLITTKDRLPRALRAALQQRSMLHARVLVLEG